MDTRKLIEVALGQRNAETVFANGQVLNVLTGEITPGDVAVYGGVVAGIGQYTGDTVIDCTGKLLCPGLIDAHLHLESTMVNPAELICLAAAHGTTCFVVDPHEAVNVAGKAGMDFMLESTRQVTANVYFMLPSCVPATAFEDGVSPFTPSDMRAYLANPRVLGLGEVMNHEAIFSGDAQMLEKLSLCAQRPIDGHAGFLPGPQLQAYALSGPRSDHEATSFEAALREAQAGLQVFIREGTAARNLEAIVKGILQSGIDTAPFCFCTDDKHIGDIQKEGHIDFAVRKAISLGLSPIKAVQMATIQAARHFSLPHLGAIAPGRQADLLVLNDLDSFEIDSVYIKGERVSASPNQAPISPAAALLRSVHVPTLSREQLRLQAAGSQPVIVLEPGQITTRLNYATLPSQDGVFVPGDGLLKLASIERHTASGKIGLGALQGFGLRGGAIASTVAHDSHNLLVIGDDDESMLLCVEALAKCGGGFALRQQGGPVRTLALEVMGLLSLQPAAQVEAQLEALRAQATQMGVVPGIDPFITMAFLSLLVLPEARITPRGVFDTKKQGFIP